MIRAWLFLLDEAGYVISRRPFRLAWEASDLALIWRDRYGFGNRVRVLRVPEAS